MTRRGWPSTTILVIAPSPAVCFRIASTTEGPSRKSRQATAFGTTTFGPFRGVTSSKPCSFSGLSTSQEKGVVAPLRSTSKQLQWLAHPQTQARLGYPLSTRSGRIVKQTVLTYNINTVLLLMLLFGFLGKKFKSCISYWLAIALSKMFATLDGIPWHCPESMGGDARLRGEHLKTARFSHLFPCPVWFTHLHRAENRWEVALTFRPLQSIKSIFDPYASCFRQYNIVSIICPTYLMDFHLYNNHVTESHCRQVLTALF